MKSKYDNLYAPEYRRKHGYMNTKEVCCLLGFTDSKKLDMLINREVLPPPDFILGTQKMRIWHKSKVEGLKDKAKNALKKKKVIEYEPCYQMDAELRSLLRDTRRFFRTMNV